MLKSGPGNPSLRENKCPCEPRASLGSAEVKTLHVANQTTLRGAACTQGAGAALLCIPSRAGGSFTDPRMGPSVRSFLRTF